MQNLMKELNSENFIIKTPSIKNPCMHAENGKKDGETEVCTILSVSSIFFIVKEKLSMPTNTKWHCCSECIFAKLSKRNR